MCRASSAHIFFFARPIRFNHRNRLHGVGTENNAFWRRYHEHDNSGDQLTVEPENQPKLIDLLRGNTENVVSRLDGWISTSFIAAKNQRHVVIYSQWRDLASVEAMRANPDMVAYFPTIAALAAFKPGGGPGDRRNGRRPQGTVRRKGQGKERRSGGYRVITFFSGTDIPVFLLNAFAKNEKADLTPKERRVLKAVLADIVKAYRSRGESR